MTYLLVISARGGSKGIPGKNIIDLCGKPLIAYSIEAAQEALSAGVNGNLIVSTDSEKIAEVARQYGCNVPFMRPAEISADTSKSFELLLHALDYFGQCGHKYDATILLQPTSPLRTSQDLLHAINIYETVKQPSLISVYKEEHICDMVSYNRNGNIAIPLNPLHNAGIRRQDYKDLYIRNGAVYITDVNYLQKEKKIISDTPALYEMPKERSVDLDTIDDLERIRWMLSKS